MLLSATFGDERTPRSRSFTDCSDPVVAGVQYWDSVTASRMMGMRGFEQLEIAALWSLLEPVEAITKQIDVAPVELADDPPRLVVVVVAVIGVQ